MIDFHTEIVTIPQIGKVDYGDKIDGLLVVNGNIFRRPLNHFIQHTRIDPR